VVFVYSSQDLRRTDIIMEEIFEKKLIQAAQAVEQQVIAVCFFVFVSIQRISFFVRSMPN